MLEIDINEIKIPADRIRFDSGKDVKKLAESIKELGQLVPIIVEKNNSWDDKQFTLIAGFRRLSAMKNLYKTDILAIIKGGLDDYTKYKIEFVENSRRKNLKLAEMVRAASKLKRLYEKTHPETRLGALGRGITKQDEQKRFAESANLYLKEEPPYSSYSEADKILMKGGTVDDIKPNIPVEADKLPEVPRFSKSFAEMTNVSERTVQDIIRVGEAIEEKKVDDEVIKQFDKGKISFTKVLKEVRKADAERKKNKKKSEPKRKLAQVKPEETTEYCLDCNFMRASICPHCAESIIICTDTNHIRDNDSEACDKFEY